MGGAKNQPLVLDAGEGTPVRGVDERTSVESADEALGEGDASERPEITVFEVASVLIRRLDIIVGVTALSVMIALVIALTTPRVYTSTVVIMPQAGESGGSSLTQLAGQFGIIDAGNLLGGGRWNAGYYAELLAMDTILRPIVTSAYTVSTEEGPQTKQFLELMPAGGNSPRQRAERGVDLLRRGILSTDESLTTGFLTIGVTTPWPEVSAEIGRRLTEELDRFLFTIRQTQAGAEREFVAARVEQARAELQMAEDSLKDFLESNRAVGGSPQLVFDQDRLQRQVSLRQNVLSGLLSAYEEARIREVRDTPAFTVIEAASVPTRPDARKRVLKMTVGLFGGLLLGVLAALGIEAFERARRAHADQAREVTDLVRQRLGSLRGLVRG